MRRWNKDRTKKEFDELLLEVRRVTRVTTWGRRMSFRAIVLVWNKKWKIWLWIAKGADVSIAVSKASREAYKNMFVVPLTKANTVPYTTTTKYKSCIVRLLPAQAGTGLKAWSSVRSVLELAGYDNMLSKIIGSNNKLNNAMATIKWLSSYKHKDFFTSIVADKKQETEEKVEKKAPAKKPAAKKDAKPVAEKKVPTKKPVTKKEAKPTVEKVEKKAPAKKPAAKKETKAVADKKPAAKKETKAAAEKKTPAKKPAAKKEEK